MQYVQLKMKIFEQNIEIKCFLLTKCSMCAIMGDEITPILVRYCFYNDFNISTTWLNSSLSSKVEKYMKLNPKFNELI